MPEFLDGLINPNISTKHEAKVPVPTRGGVSMSEVIETKPNKTLPTIIIEYGRRKVSVFPMFEWEVGRIHSLRNSLNSSFLSASFSTALAIGIAIKSANLSHVWLAVFIALSILTAFFAIRTFLDRKEYKRMFKELERNGYTSQDDKPQSS